MKSKAAAKVKKTTTVAHDEVQEFMDAQVSKNMFFSSTANMGFRLAVTVVIPIVVGVKLDQRFHTAPSLTLAGLFLATGAACVVVWDTVKEVNKKQLENDAKTKKSKRRVKRA